MRRAILGQATFQLIVFFVLLYKGHDLFDIEELEATHRTILFNTFVFMQLFNEFNCRSIRQVGSSRALLTIKLAFAINYARFW
jgi:magnesium-transporting ATPase (P-type)